MDRQRRDGAAAGEVKKGVAIAAKADDGRTALRGGRERARGGYLHFIQLTVTKPSCA